jgi:hypothetical protein
MPAVIELVLHRIPAATFERQRRLVGLARAWERVLGRE